MPCLDPYASSYCRLRDSGMSKDEALAELKKTYAHYLKPSFVADVEQSEVSTAAYVA